MFGLPSATLEREVRLLEAEDVFVPGRTFFRAIKSTQGDLKDECVRDKEQEEEKKQPSEEMYVDGSGDLALRYQPLVPSQLAVPNGFLSNSLRCLTLSFGHRQLQALMPWMTRAALEGHLQGLVTIEFSRILSAPTSSVEWEVLQQFLESCPRLEEFSALSIEVKSDPPHGRINADILDGRSKEMAARRQQSLRLSTLSLFNMWRDDRDKRQFIQFLERLPHLVNLTLWEDSLPDVVEVIENRGSLSGMEFQPLTGFSFRQPMPAYGPLDPDMLQSWRDLVSSPSFRFVHLDLSHREEVPGDLLDFLVQSSAISTLKTLGLSPLEPVEMHEKDVGVTSGTLLRFLRRAIALEWIKFPWLDPLARREVFTTQEAARWPCRERLREIHAVSMNFNGDEKECDQFRRWLWSFPNLTVAVVKGSNATPDILVEVTPLELSSHLPGASGTIATPLPRPPLPRLAIKILELTALDALVKLDQIQELVEYRMPKLTTLKIGRMEGDAANWLKENYPSLMLSNPQTSVALYSCR
ncbi:hypothetical protein EMPS_07127 [Entomortierella parvispora]|uniref:Uncharacterized protein n=1 Tax=Entomortierella parvispora TaxID=205924 RepID=A0A9P3LY23_9FUNG|nr:hypothetical protein EMPS_07127 [Entomortierella parvispora]